MYVPATENEKSNREKQQISLRKSLAVPQRSPIVDTGG